MSTAHSYNRYAGREKATFIRNTFSKSYFLDTEDRSVTDRTGDRMNFSPLLCSKTGQYLHYGFLASVPGVC